MTDSILRKTDIKRLVGFSDVTIREMEAAGAFPRRFKLNPNGRQVGWKASSVAQWIEERAATVVAA